MAVSHTTIKRLREERAALVAEGEKLLNLQESEERDLSQEESAQFDRIHEDADKLRDRIDKMERQYFAEKDLASAPDSQDEGRDDDGEGGDESGGGSNTRDLRPTLDLPGEPKLTAEQVDQKTEELREQIFENWIRGGDEAIADKDLDELRDLGVTTDNKGGYAIPSLVYERIIVPIKEIDAVRRAGATIVTVDTSGAFDVPYIDDEDSGGNIVAENASDSDDSPDFGRGNLQDFRFTSDAIPVSEIALQSRSDLEAVIYRLLRQRLAQRMQAGFTTGTGSGQPRGVLTGAVSGKTAAAAAALAHDDIVDLFHSVRQSYRAMPSFGSMMSDATLGLIRKIKDGDGRPLFQVSEVLGTPDMVYGKPVYTNEAMPAVAASATPIVVGAFEHYTIKDVRNTRIKRDPFTRASKDQVVFHGNHYAGGDITDPTAFRKLTMAG